jgi:hypothetical protein
MVVIYLVVICVFVIYVIGIFCFEWLWFSDSNVCKFWFMWLFLIYVILICLIVVRHWDWCQCGLCNSGYLDMRFRDGSMNLVILIFYHCNFVIVVGFWGIVISSIYDLCSCELWDLCDYDFFIMIFLMCGGQSPPTPTFYWSNFLSSFFFSFSSSFFSITHP